MNHNVNDNHNNSINIPDPFPSTEWNLHNTLSLSSVPSSSLSEQLSYTNTSHITPRKRLHHETMPHFNNTLNSNIFSTDIDMHRYPQKQNQMKRMKTNNHNLNINLYAKSVCVELRKTLKRIFLFDEQHLNTLYEPEMVELIKAMAPHYSLGKAWATKYLPNSIPDYPIFYNNYNKLRTHNKSSVSNYIIGDNTNNNNRNDTIDTLSHRSSETSPYTATIWQPLTLIPENDWNNLSAQQQVNVWSRAFVKHVENYKFKLNTKQTILATDKINVSMISVGLQMYIYYFLKLMEQKHSKAQLVSYYNWIGKLLNCWEKYIESNNNTTLRNDNDYINCLLSVGHGYLVHGMLIQEIEGKESGKSRAREQYIKCIHRIRSAHKLRKENMIAGDEERQRCDIRRFEVNATWSEHDVTAATLRKQCDLWNWLHFDLNRNQKYTMLDYDPVVFESEVGVYDGWIIEAYARLSHTFDAGSKEKFNCLHKTLKLLRNKDGLCDIVSIRLMIDYAYTFLEKDNVEDLDKYYWYYLMRIAMSLININQKKKILNVDQVFDVSTRFFCCCIMTGLHTQYEFPAMMRNFVKDNMESKRTKPKKAICRFVRVAYTAMYYGLLHQANDLYRCARSLVQYWTNLELQQPVVYPIGKRLMDEFEIWWDFNHFCVYFIAAITAHCCIHYDSSCFYLVCDLVSWRNQCSRMMFNIAGLPNDTTVVNNEYYGYYTQYIDNARKLAFFGAQAMILCLLHSHDNCKVDGKQYTGRLYAETVCSVCMEQNEYGCISKKTK